MKKVEGSIIAEIVRFPLSKVNNATSLLCPPHPSPDVNVHLHHVTVPHPHGPHPAMDTDYPFDFASEHDHPDLNSLTAADIEAIGSGFTSPLNADIALPGPVAQEVDDLEAGAHFDVDPLTQDFLHGNGHGHGQGHAHAHAHDEQDHGHGHEHDYVPDPNPDIGAGADVDAEADRSGSPSGSRRRMNPKDTAGMTTDEKKQRTRDSNRRAAEKSRAKKRKEQ